MNFHGEMVYLMLHYLSVRKRSEGLVVFDLKDNELEFGPREFFIMSGLAFGPLKVLPTRSDVYEKIFRNKKIVKVKDIKTAFVDNCDQFKGNGDICLKLAYLLFLYGVLLRKEDQKSLDVKYLHLVDDLPTFNTYPWGLISYQYLAAELFLSYDQMQTKLSNEQIYSFDVFGFLFALQAWIYEVLPDIGKICGTRVRGWEFTFPRILRWSAKKVFRFKDLKEKIFDDDVVIRVESINLEVEEQQSIDTVRDYFHVKPVVDPIHVPVKSHVLRRKIIYDPNGTKKEGLKRHYALRSHSKNHSSNDTKEDSTPSTKLPAQSPSSVSEKELLGRLSSLERMTSTIYANVGHIMTWMKKHEHCVVSCGQRGVGLDDYLAESERAEKNSLFEMCGASNKNLMKDTKDHVFDVTSNDTLHSEDDASVVAMKFDNSIHNPIELSSNSEASKSFAPIKLGTIKEKGIYSEDSSKEKPCKKVATSHEIGFFDPLKPCPLGLLQAFKQWYFHPIRRETRLGLLSRDVAWPIFFECIWIKNNWLEDTHVDALINLLILKAKKAPRQFLSRWTCLEYICWGKMQSKNFSKDSTLMMKYVRGQCPIQGGVAWKDVDHIYGVGHIFGNHWVCYDINLDMQMIVVYDSKSRNHKWKDVKAEFRNMSRCISWLCLQENVMDDRKLTIPYMDEWDVVQYVHPPQQMNDHDCGIFTIKYMECLASGLSVNLIDPKLSADFREYFCAELYHTRFDV